MAVAENAGVKIDQSNQNLDNSTPNCPEKQKPRNDQASKTTDTTKLDVSVGEDQVGQVKNGLESNGVKDQQISINDLESNDIGELVENFSKLNPKAKEFVPPSLAYNVGYMGNGAGFGYTNNFAVHPDAASLNEFSPRRRKNNYNPSGKRRMNNRTSMAQHEEVIRRTVYVSDIDHQVTEEHLAALFNSCGQVVDCRVCGDPKSCLRFAFIEFTDEEAARVALNLGGTILGFYPLKVMPSKTAIAPVNPTYLPRSDDEREMCSRTVYVTNIDKKITQNEVKLFFETMCGEVLRLRLLGDFHHSTRIAFVEFVLAESAIAALSCSGAVIGSLPIRVSPSKTPVKARLPRFPSH